MSRLTSREATSLSRAISSLYSNQFTTPLPERIFAALRQIASADWYALDSFNPRGYWLDKSWVEPLTGVTHDEMIAFGEYCHEHPLYRAFVETGLPEPRKTTDYVTTQQFHRLGIYNEFFRRVGTDRQIVCGLSVSPDLTLVLSLNRNRSDFTESHCRVLEALKPNLLAAHDDAAIMAELQYRQAQLQVALEKTGAGAILIGAGGVVELITARAEQWLLKYFCPRNCKPDGLPNQIKEWAAFYQRPTARYGAVLEPVPPLQIHSGDARLQLRLLTDEASGKLLILLTEEIVFSSVALESLGLTHREAEVLRWLTLGKTNSEIAILCDISERTVHKHLEHIYQKLGVETRIAAMQQALALKASQ